MAKNQLIIEMAILHTEIIEKPSKNKPIVLLHGLLGAGANFKTLARELNSTVILVDQRNHGQSFHSPDMGYDIMAKDLHETLASLKIAKINLVGHSMGGKVALAFAGQYSESIENLIIADIAPINYGGHISYFEEMIDLLCSLDITSLSSKGDLLAPIAAVYGETVAKFILTNLAWDDSLKYYWRLNLKALRQNMPVIVSFLKDAPRYKAEINWISGSKSTYLTPEIYESVKMDYPNSILHTLDSGHWVHYEQRAKFIEIINQICC